MAKEVKNTIAVLIGSHGEEMEVGGRLLKKLQTAPINGVAARISHPEAVAAGQRYLGTGSDAEQIMARYPGDPYGDPEQQAAYANLEWIQEINPLVVLDNHETTIPGSYCCVGKRTTPAALASGISLGNNRILVENSSFHQCVPKSAGLEFSLAESDPEVTAEKFYQGLQKLAGTDLMQLPNTFEDTIFYKKIPLMTTKLQTTQFEVLQDLEEIPSEPFFSPLSLPKKIRTLLGLSQQTPLFYETWGHNNMSKQKPERLGYTKLGIPRRECFGGILIEIPPPKQTKDGFLIFEQKKH